MPSRVSRSASHPLLKVLAVRDFRLLWVGQLTSLLGSQFSLIALPWLVLQLTHDPVALGVVLALSGVPRLLLMLVGGVIADRFPPRAILLIADLVSFILTGLLMALTLTGQIQLWMVYALSLLFGLCGGFVMPAASAIVPALLPSANLQTGNALTQGTNQLTSFLGPVLAGATIAYFTPAHTPGGAGLLGLALAFGIDAVSFAFSALMLAWMQSGRAVAPVEEAQKNVLEAIRTGVRYVWETPVLRKLFGLLSLTNLAATGPLLVGIPVLANQRLPGGAAAFGIIMSAYGGGNLVGIVLAGVLPRLKPVYMNLLVVGVLISFGLGLGAFGWLTATWLGFLIMLLMGLGNGYLVIIIITQLQRRTPPYMMGRVMSLFMFCVLSLTPLSQLIAGWISGFTLTGLFALAGGLMLGVAAWIALDSQTRATLVEMVVVAETP